jgi:3-dehydroquinate dehydratase II
MAHDRISVMHGVNLDALDRRPSEIYGDLTFTKLERAIEEFAGELGLRVRFFQTNSEREFVEELHRAADSSDALVLNPGAWTHYSWAIRDALEIAGLPTVEVHLSDVDAREDFRKVSVIRDHCIATVKGKGVEGYREALQVLKERIA